MGAWTISLRCTRRAPGSIVVKSTQSVRDVSCPARCCLWKLILPAVANPDDIEPGMIDLVVAILEEGIEKISDSASLLSFSHKLC